MNRIVILAIVTLGASSAFASNASDKAARMQAAFDSQIAKKQANWAQIQKTAQGIHRADQRGYIQSSAKVYGIPERWSKPVYQTINKHGGGVNAYTAKDIATKPYTPTYRR